MTDYKPGTVAIVTSDCTEPTRRIYGEYAGNGYWYEGHGGFVRAENVIDVRPLVVLDLDADNVAHALRKVAGAAAVYGLDPEVDVARQIADQIEAQTKPPKPTEPTGLGAVVEDSEGHLWVRAGSDAHVALKNCWRATAGEYVGDWQTFDRIDVIRVLSEGVES